MDSSRTVSVEIKRDPDEVYNYLADPMNLPRWSIFITDVKPLDDRWQAQTPQGSVELLFSPVNEFRVLDHWVTIKPGVDVYVPMRVLARPGGGSEVIFTVFRQSQMSDQQFDDDVGMVLTDLSRLKAALA